MSKNTDSSIKLLVLYDILLKMTDDEHALSTNEIIAELQFMVISSLKSNSVTLFRTVLVDVKPSKVQVLNVMASSAILSVAPQPWSQTAVFVPIVSAVELLSNT